MINFIHHHLNFNNYLNYQYETPEAENLLTLYNELKTQSNLETVSDYLQITDQVNDLYLKFLNLFNYNRIVKFRSGISAGPEYYLSYRDNDEYVCEKFLKDTELFDAKLHTEIYQLEVEREVLVNVLEIEKEYVYKFKNDAEILAEGLSFEHKENKRKGFIASMMMLLSVLAILVSYILGFFGGKEVVNLLYSGSYIQVCNYILLGMLGVAFIVSMIATAKYHRLNEAYDLIDSIEKDTKLAIKMIDGGKDK